MYVRQHVCDIHSQYSTYSIFTISVCVCVFAFVFCVKDL